MLYEKHEQDLPSARGWEEGPAAVVLGEEKSDHRLGKRAGIPSDLLHDVLFQTHHAHLVLEEVEHFVPHSEGKPATDVGVQLDGHGVNIQALSALCLSVSDVAVHGPVHLTDILGDAKHSISVEAKSKVDVADTRDGVFNALSVDGNGV